ncbi:MAG: hypothetical protein WB628_12430 [Candidatus Sulfotelmatobacter sp.]
MKSNIQWVTEQLAEIRTRLNRLERLRREEVKAAAFRDDVDSFLYGPDTYAVSPDVRRPG